MANLFLPHSWETLYFTYQAWQPDEVWCSLTSPEEFTAPQARAYFWENAQARITAELDRWIHDGWELTEAVGPDAIQLRKFERIDFSLNVTDVFLWFMTLGVALILQSLLNTPRRYTFYQPIQFRVRLRKRKARQHQVAA